MEYIHVITVETNKGKKQQGSIRNKSRRVSEDEVFDLINGKMGLNSNESAIINHLIMTT